MKKYLFLSAAIIATLNSNAQEITSQDALHYATDNITGSARFRAMSGAFGAIGGDISAMNVNPAGSAIFNYNTGTASLTSFNTKNTSNYFGTKSNKNDNSLEINQIGAVFVFTNQNENAKLKKFSFAINYENTANFDDKSITKGINPTNSIDQYFMQYANGIGNQGGIFLDVLKNSSYSQLNFPDQQAYLGYNAFIFDPVADTGNNSQYISNVRPGGDYYQENYISSKGYNGKLTANFAMQYQNWLYLGANINAHFTDYMKFSSLYEDYYDVATGAGLHAVRFDNEIYTYGAGFSFNLGAIAKITEEFRFGLAYESPTWYNLQDELRQSISSYCPQCDANNPRTDTFVTNPGYVNVYDDYSLRTPAKYTGSLAYIFGKQGLLSLDYAIKDYSTTKFNTGGYDDLNNILSNNLELASEIRIGAEYRIKQFSLRGGYRFEQSPYKNGNTMGDLTGYSGGIGFNFRNSRLDLAYSHFKRDANVALLSSGFTDTAKINNKNNNVTLSYTIDL